MTWGIGTVVTKLIPTAFVATTTTNNNLYVGFYCSAGTRVLKHPLHQPSVFSLSAKTSSLSSLSKLSLSSTARTKNGNSDDQSSGTFLVESVDGSLVNTTSIVTAAAETNAPAEISEASTTPRNYSRSSFITIELMSILIRQYNQEQLELLSLDSQSYLIKQFRDVYSDLERPTVFDEYAGSTTIRFSYVTPPIQTTQVLSNGAVVPITISTWKNPTIQSMTKDELPIELHPSSTKPLAVYLPGLDGYGISGVAQFNDLASKFELWRLIIYSEYSEDRTPFSDLINKVTNFIQELSLKTNRPVVLIGESCGGLLATAVAIRLQSLSSEQQQRTHEAKEINNIKGDIKRINENDDSSILKGLVLVNPATSFDTTAWDLLVPILTSLQYLDPRRQRRQQNTAINDNVLTPYAVLGSLLLSAVIPDNGQLFRIVDTIIASSEAHPTQAVTSDPSQAMDTLKHMLQVTEQRLSPELLQHRVMKWLLPGTSTVNERLHVLQNVPILFIVGEEDKLLPSKQEPERFKNVMGYGTNSGNNNIETLRVPDRGHFVLDDSINITEAIIYSKNIDPLNRIRNAKTKYDPIMDWKLPTNMNHIISESIQPFRDTFSPIFISTDRNGKRWMGVHKIPTMQGNRSILFVGNHQLLALDMQLYMSELLEQRGMFARGLAHPVTFSADQKFDLEIRDRTPGFIINERTKSRRASQFGPLAGTTSFENFGAVVVTPRNYYRLLQSGQNVLLFPGGAKEALSVDRSYPLHWPKSKTDFVRTAARFNATIVPFSSVGMVDSFNILLEPKYVVHLPILGDWAREQNMNMSRARYDSKPEEDEFIGFPLVGPTMPQRNYFLFGQPIDTTRLDPHDEEECARVYKMTQNAVRRGIDDLIKARQHDPFRDSIKRLLYERIFQKKAPTFPIDVLNRKQ